MPVFTKRALRLLTACLLALSVLSLGPSAFAAAPPSVQFCGANQVCGQASSLTMTPSLDAPRGHEGVDVTVQFTLPAELPRAQLQDAAVFASRLATVHVGTWTHLIPQPLRFDDSGGCSDSPCTEPTATGQYTLHFVLTLPPGFPLGYHPLWLTVPADNGQTLSSPRYGYATPLPQPKLTLRRSGNVFTLTIASSAFRLASAKRPIDVWATAQLPSKRASGFPAASTGDQLVLRHPAQTVTLTFALRPAGGWYIDWRMSPHTGYAWFEQVGGERFVRVSG